MSFATLERAVLHGARKLFMNPTLRKKDISAWATQSENLDKDDGEVMAYVPDPGVYVVLKTKWDKRPAKKKG